jgi:hypothetical protein
MFDRTIDTGHGLLDGSNGVGVGPLDLRRIRRQLRRDHRCRAVQVEQRPPWSHPGTNVDGHGARVRRAERVAPLGPVEHRGQQHSSDTAPVDLRVDEEIAQQPMSTDVARSREPDHPAVADSNEQPTMRHQMGSIGSIGPGVVVLTTDGVPHGGDTGAVLVSRRSDVHPRAPVR